MNNKLGIVSDLAACKIAFSNVDIPWVIMGGIVLGYARYKDIMDWDTDVDIAIFSEVTDTQWVAVCDSLTKQGYKLSNSPRKDFTYNKRQTPFNMDLYHKNGNFYNSFPTTTPGLKFVEKAEWFDEIQMVDFLGDKYPMPNHIYDFVAAHYGSDWKTNIIKEHEKYFTDKRGGRDRSLWLTSRAGKSGDLWPKILETTDSMGESDGI
jgi:phosphorylcholine metabolism protein LicD